MEYSLDPIDNCVPESPEQFEAIELSLFEWFVDDEVTDEFEVS